MRVKQYNESFLLHSRKNNQNHTSLDIYNDDKMWRWFS